MIKIWLFDADGEEIYHYESCFIPCVDDKIRVQGGDYYIVNRRVFQVDLNSVILHCAYYGNID